MRSHSPEPGEELDSPYVEDGMLDLAAWAHDALALTLPRAILCREDCAGLCPVCGVDLNTAGSDHHHEAEPDPRWAKLSEVRFDRRDRACYLPPSWPFPSKSSPIHARPSVARPTRSSAAATNACPTCHSPRLPHRVCPVCGSYKGRTVVATDSSLS